MPKQGTEESGGIDSPLAIAAECRRLDEARHARGAVFARGGNATDLRCWTLRGVEVREGALLAGEIVGWILAEIDRIASHLDPYSPPCSRTIRTARYRASCENLFLRAMPQSSQ